MMRNTTISQTPRHRPNFVGDLDAKSEKRLEQVFGLDYEDDQALFDPDNNLVPLKKIGDSKIKKLKVENKQLKEQIKKLKLYVSTDKTLKKMKLEYNDCVSDCK